MSKGSKIKKYFEKLLNVDKFVNGTEYTPTLPYGSLSIRYNFDTGEVDGNGQPIYVEKVIDVRLLEADITTICDALYSARGDWTSGTSVKTSLITALEAISVELAV
jgi:hypothetical protein